jgi:hypothetical protein
MKSFHEKFKDQIDMTDGTVTINEEIYKSIQQDAVQTCDKKVWDRKYNQWMFTVGTGQTSNDYFFEKNDKGYAKGYSIEEIKQNEPMEYDNGPRFVIVPIIP